MCGCPPIPFQPGASERGFGLAFSVYSSFLFQLLGGFVIVTFLFFCVWRWLRPSAFDAVSFFSFLALRLVVGSIAAAVGSHRLFLVTRLALGLLCAAFSCVFSYPGASCGDNSTKLTMF